MRSARESTAFGICESKASAAETLLQQPIFVLEVLDRLELPTIDPTGKQRQEQMQRLDGTNHLVSIAGDDSSSARPRLKWAVRVIGYYAIEPGGIRTGIVERNLRSPRIDAYGGTAHAIIDLLQNDKDGALAPSDPNRIAQILVELVQAGEMPQRLVLGPDSWAGITAKLAAQLAEYEEWKDVSRSTSFS